MGSDWTGYYAMQQGRAPREIFLDAVGRFDLKGPSQLRAADVGSGDGTEAVYLVERGWDVLALDAEREAVDLVESRCPPDLRARLTARQVSFEEMDLGSGEWDFVYAGFSLPFCRPARFPSVWRGILEALRPGGRFAGQLFGDRDTWATNPDMNFHTQDDARRLLQGLVVERFDAREDDGDSFSGPKHWHVYDFVARAAG